MSELDRLGRTPEQAAREQAEIQAAFALGGEADQKARERAEIRRALDADERARRRSESALMKAQDYVDAMMSDEVDLIVNEAQQAGYSTESARRMARKELRALREQRIAGAYDDFIVREP